MRSSRRSSGTSRRALALDADRIARADAERRGVIYERCVRFFAAARACWLCPCVIVPPFDVDTRWVDEIEGHRFDNYVDWLGMTFVLTLTPPCPSASVPVGFTASGLPVGLQILGPPRGARRRCCGRRRRSRRRSPVATPTPIDPLGPDGAALPLG